MEAVKVRRDWDVFGLEWSRRSFSHRAKGGVNEERERDGPPREDEAKKWFRNTY